MGLLPYFARPALNMDRDSLSGLIFDCWRACSGHGIPPVLPHVPKWNWVSATPTVKGQPYQPRQPGLNSPCWARDWVLRFAITGIRDRLVSLRKLRAELGCLTAGSVVCAQSLRSDMVALPYRLVPETCRGYNRSNRFDSCRQHSDNQACQNHNRSSRGKGLVTHSERQAKAVLPDYKYVRRVID